MARLGPAIEDTNPPPLAEPPIGRGYGAELMRQLGLTARYGMEGVGDNVAAFLSSPIRGAMNLFGANASPTPFADLADTIGLPKPENATERVVGDVSRGAAGAANLAGAARAVGASAPGVAGAVMRSLGTDPVMAKYVTTQTASGAGAGAAGGLAREDGASPIAQFLAAVGGGVAPAAGASALRAAGGAVRGMQSVPLPRLEMRIQQALSNAESPVEWRSLAPDVQASIRRDVAAAGNLENLSDAAIRRLADYRTVRATPGRGNVTLDPIDLSRQKNLERTGAASRDQDLQTFARRPGEVNARLLEVLDDAGARNALDAYATGEGIAGNIAAQDAAWAARNQRLYDAYREATGKALELDRTYFTDAAFRNLADSGKGAFLPTDVRKWLNSISLNQGRAMGRTHEVPFTIDTIDQYKTVLSNAMKAAENDGNARAAIRAVRDALDSTPILEPRTHLPPAPAGSVRVSSEGEQAAQEAMRLADEARAAHRARMQWQESHPAIRDIADELRAKGRFDPDKFMQEYVVGRGENATVNNLRRLREVIGNDENAINQVRGYMVRWIKERAVGGEKGNDVSNLTGERMNRALNEIGDRKLAVFFSPDEIAQLRATGRVAQYEHWLPSSHGVNTSNTANNIQGRVMDWITGNPLAQAPFVRPIVNRVAPAFQQDIALRFTQNLPGALRRPPGPRVPPPLPLGLLGFNPSDQ